MGRALFSVSAVLLMVVSAIMISSPAASAQSSFQDEIANLKSPNVSTRVKAPNIRP